MKSSNFRFMTGLSALVLLAFPQLHAQNAAEIPPPSEVQPDRIRIPIREVQERIDESKEKPTADEIAAFAAAANANGWIPEGSSGWLRSGMMIRVTVMVQGNLEHATEPQRINHTGKIGLPLLQNVNIGEMDLVEAENLLTKEYEVYYREPLISIQFVGDTKDPNICPWGYVSIMGKVNAPGPVAMPPTQNLTISGAVKLSGGLTPSADKDSIRIFRPHPEEESVEVIKVNLEVLAKRGEQAEDVRLRAGDVVYIRERIF